MKKILNEYKLFFVFLFISLWSSLHSSGVNRAFALPMTLNRIFTLLMYLPFILFITWKLLSDIQQRKLSPASWVYYGFAAYYALVSGYRLLNGMEVKESLYYSLLLFGSLAMYFQIRAGHMKMTRQEYLGNFLAIGSFMILFRLVDRLVFRLFLPDAPINVNLTTGVNAILIPVLVEALCDRNTPKKQRLFSAAVLIGSYAVIWTSGSRAIFTLIAVITGVLLLVRITDKAGLIRLGAVLLCAAAIVGSMAAADIGRTRYFLVREMNLVIPAAPVQTSPTDGTAESPSQDLTQGSSIQAATQEQISASDGMRADLINMGIEQIKLNPLFGTGDVLYPYAMSETYIPTQSSHNFIIESLICYGIIGTALLAVLFLMLIVDAHIFSKDNQLLWREKLSLLLTLVFFFGFAMVQPTVFSQFLCPVFAWLLASYHDDLNNPKGIIYETKQK